MTDDLELRRLVEGLRSDLRAVPELIARQRHLREALDRIHFRLSWPAGVLPPGNNWAASPDMLLHVVETALEQGPAVAVECGSGTSTLLLARCMQLAGRGHVYSLEQDASHVALTRRNLEIAGVSQWATVIHAPMVPYSLQDQDYGWYSLADLPDLPIDLLVVDGPVGMVGKLTRYPAGPLLFPRLAPGGIVFLDDLRREEERRSFARWRLERPDLVAGVVETERGLGVLKMATV
ncbi:MAG: hypothetical protein RLY86_169 [Pseudomonadota bacterium]|jgi:predicted O-methyltransferase YrrM